MPGRTENAVVIAAPMDLVWRRTNDVANWPSLFTEYASAEILRHDGETVRFRLTTHPDEHGEQHTWVSERTPDQESRTVRARRVEAGPLLEYMNLTWTYRDVPGGVELRWVQEFAVTPAAPVDDRGAERFLNQQTAVEMANIKRVLEAEAA
ncbi:SRPBCC family protein [Micromonospora sp. CPCC 205371]|nr:SRPBCC family protein [Micromonospora sp. CPCC 205371]